MKELIAAEYNGDFSGSGDYQVNVTIKNGGGEEITDTFYVQLSGGEHLSQMGCWITGGQDCDGDINFEEYRDGIFYDFIDKIIACAERGYSKENELEKEGWDFVRSTQYRQVSATSTTCITVEKNTGKEADRFRAFTDNSGFTQPNDYSSMPDFKVEYFDEEPSDELLEEIFGNER